MSPLKMARELEGAIGKAVAKLDIDALPLAQQKMIADLRRQATDIRLDTRDYDFAETRVEQQATSREARTRLEQMRQNIVATSHWDIFSAVEVAHLSAQIQQLISSLQ